MEYVILDKTVYIDGTYCGSFVYILDISNGIIKANLGNTSHNFSIIMVDNNIEQSVKDFFHTFTN